MRETRTLSNTAVSRLTAPLAAMVFAVLTVVSALPVRASVTVFGPTTLNVPADKEATFSETVTVPADGCATGSALYTVVIMNGRSDGTGKLKSLSVEVNGVSILGDEVAFGQAVIEVPLVLLATNTLTGKVAGSHKDGVVSITVRRQMTTPVLPEKGFTLATSKKDTFVETFPTTSQQPGPYTLVLVNGGGANLPVDDATIVLNGTKIISKGDIDSRGNQNILQTIVRTVALQAQNTMSIELKSNKTPAGVKLRIVRPVADAAGPVIALNGIQNNQVFAAATATVAGTVSDPIGVTSFKVNTADVSVSPDGSFRKDVNLTPGTNRIVLDALDCEGNATHVELTVFRDVASPQVTITAPAANALLKTATVVVTGTASDDTGIASVTVNGQTATLSGSSWSAGITFPPAGGTVDGTRTITVLATDRSGKQASATTTVNVDTTAPAITAGATPAPNAAGWNRSDVTVTFACTDGGSGVATCNAPVTISTEGAAQTATGTAADKAGNTKSATLTVKLDKTAPLVTVLSPADQAAESQASVTIQGTVSDALSGAAGVTCGAVTATLSGSTFTCSVPLNEGGNDIAVIATDVAGNARTATLHITHGGDQSAPVLNVTAPGAGTFFNTRSVTVTGTVSDDKGVASVTVNGQAATVNGGIFTAAIVLTAGADGPRDIVVIATDTSSKTTTVRVPVTMDLTPPAITAQRNGVQAGEGWTNRPIVVTFQCADALSGIATCPGPVTLSAEGPDQVANGTAVDVAGNRASVALHGAIDLTAPLLTVEPPSATLQKSTALTLRGTASDSLSGLSSVLCNGISAVMSGASFTCAVTLVSGDNAIDVNGVDSAGNITTSQVSVTVDQEKPVIVLVSPANGSTTSENTVTVVGQAVDDDSVAGMTLNGSPLPASADGSFRVPMPLQEGINAIAITATDRAGNVATLSATVRRYTVPSITIAAPADLSVIRTPSVIVRGSVSDSSASVTVNGVPASLTGTGFAAEVPLQQGRTVITAVAAMPAGPSASASLNIYRDSIPPRIMVYAPADGATVYETPISVTGMVDDIVVGTINAGQVRVTVNDRDAEVSNRAFLMRSVDLVPGTNTLLIAAIDQGGNRTVASYHVTLAPAQSTAHLIHVAGNDQEATIGALLPQPIVVSVLNAAGQAVAGQPLTFRVIENNGLLVAGSDRGRSVTVPANAQGQASVQWTLGTRSGAGNQRLEVRGAGMSPIQFQAIGRTGPPALIVADSGGGQFGIAGEVLPRPLVAVAVDTGSNRLGGVPVTFTVTQGGGNFAGQPAITVITDSDGRAIAQASLGPDEGQDNNIFTASVASGAHTASFDASGRRGGPPADTRISGVILDNTNLPVPGASVRIEGTSFVTQSNGQGQFRLNGVPVGYAKLLIDGSTVQRPGTWPTLEFTMYTLPGVDNTVGRPIFLLPIDVQHGINVDETHGGTLTLPDLPGFSLTISPGAATFPGGSRTGTVSVTMVHADKMPMTPGFGQQPRFILTIQPPGTHFDPPARISFPNVDGLAPGEVTEMYSFDHDLGQFVAIGTGSVSEDGTVIQSDPGVGIIKGGWHCGGNPAASGTSQHCNDCQKCVGPACEADPAKDGTRCQADDNPCVFGLCQTGACNTRVPTVEVTVESPADNFNIQTDPRMPVLVAKAKIRGVSPDPTASSRFRWALHIDYLAANRVRHIRLDPPPVEGGPEFRPTFSVNRGGDLKIIATLLRDGHACASSPDKVLKKINGLNPPFVDVRAALGNNDTLAKIACHESIGGRQFRTSPGTPITHVEPDGRMGVGLMQVTDAPTDEAFWSWRRNLIEGVAIYNGKGADALDYQQRMQARGAPALTAQQQLQNQVTLFNGGYYWKYKGGKWVADPNLQPWPACRGQVQSATCRPYWDLVQEANCQ